MRKLRYGAGLAAIIAVAAPGCHRKFKEPVSIIEMADREATNQLLAGFHQLEDNRWRWTARKFSVILKPPPHAEERGATLQLQLYVPPGQIEKLGTIRLDADAAGYPLGSQTFSSGGQFSYSRDIPPAELRTNILPVNFCFDQAVPPGKDSRELAAIVTSVSLRPK